MFTRAARVTLISKPARTPPRVQHMVRCLMPTTGRICRRDGELPCYIEFHGVRVELGSTELRSILRCAQHDLQNASGSGRRVLEQPLEVLNELINIGISLQRPGTDVDQKRNRDRFHATGQGGETDIDELQRLCDLWRARFRVARTNEEHREHQDKYSEDMSITE